MERFVYIALVASVLWGCGEPTSMPVETAPEASLVELGPGFVASPQVRRGAMESSLVDPTNGYSRLRLAEYGLGDRGWDALPIRNFPVRPATTEDIGRFADNPYAVSDGHFSAVFEEAEFEWTEESLLELGRRAFHEYPLEIEPTLAAAVVDEGSVHASGLWQTEDRLGGMVRARTPDGMEVFAATCSTCHASTVDGQLVDGRANPNLDRGAMIRLFHGGEGSDWGPGRVDVTNDGVTNPVAITDLRPIRYQRRLHWAATLYNSPAALAARVETLMITSAGEAARPPREVAVALAYYLWSLGEETRKPAQDSDGADLFEQDCSTCHGMNGTTSDPVDIAAIGTHPAAGRSMMRGTGTYRIPSLYRVGSRSQYLHEGKVKSLDELFSPERLTSVPGHVYGTALSTRDRAALVEFLRSL